MKTMKTFLIAIFTVLTTLSFSQEQHVIVFNEDTVEITIGEFNYSHTLPVSGKVSDITNFYVKIINESDGDIISNSFNESDWNINDGKLGNRDTTTFQKNDLVDIEIKDEIGATITIEFDLGTVGLKENTQTVFSLYPNPTTDFLNIKGDNVETVKVFNTSGQIVLSDKGSNFGDTKLDVTSLKNGVYMVMVNDGKPVRFIKR